MCWASRASGCSTRRLPSCSSKSWSCPGPGRAPVSGVTTYGFTLHSPRGEPEASWDVTGQGSEPIANPFAAVSTVRRSFEQAMREAAWRLTSGFRDVPEVRRWLNEQGVR